MNINNGIMKLKVIFSSVFMLVSSSLIGQQTKILSGISAYQYDSNGKEIENHFYTCTNGNEEGPDKTFTHYNADGSIKEQVIIDMYNDTMQKNVYLYNGDQITITFYDYYGAEAVASGKVVYYGVEDKIETEEQVVSFLVNIPMFACDSFQLFIWNTISWEKNMSGIYTYNQYQNPTKLLLKINQGMEFDLQINYQYDARQNCIQMIANVVVYNMPLSLMNIDQTFDQNDKLLETYMYPNVNPLLEQAIGSTLDSFLIEQKVRYAYNSRGDIETVTSLMFDETLSVFIETAMNEYVYKSIQVNAEEVYVVDTVYTYVITSVQGVEEALKALEDISLYPNPVVDILYVDGLKTTATYTIFDLTGKDLYTQTVSPGTTGLSLQTLAKGMYIVKIQNEKGVYQAKVMKK